MPNRITAIIPQQKDRFRYNIYINDAYGFSVSADLAAGLHTGDDLTESRIDALKTADQNGQAYARALRYLGFRPRSRMEVIQYLEKKGFGERVVESAVSRLESFGYIDDDAFARFWIDSRARHRPRGDFALRWELRSKGISDAVIERLLSGHDELESAWRSVCRKIESWKTLDNTGFKKRIYSFLQRRGFAGATCEAVVSRALDEMERRD